MIDSMRRPVRVFIDDEELRGHMMVVVGARGVIRHIMSKDEYVEVTPSHLRLRKIYLKEVDRKRNKAL